jgi:hypothetical protein
MIYEWNIPHRYKDVLDAVWAIREARTQRHVRCQAAFPAWQTQTRIDSGYDLFYLISLGSHDDNHVVSGKADGLINDKPIIGFSRIQCRTLAVATSSGSPCLRQG